MNHAERQRRDEDSTRTFERWSQLGQDHIAPGIGKHKLTSLKPAHLEAFYRELLTSGR